MAILVLSEAMQALALDGMKAATPGALGGKLGLVHNPTPLTPRSVFADLEFCTYGGYANSSAITFTADYRDINGRFVTIIEPKVFVPNDSTASDTATQVVLVDSTGLILLASYVLDTPIAFSTPDDLYLIGMALMIGQPNDFPMPDIVP